MFIFNTKNLDEKFYQNMIRRILYEFFTAKQIIEFLNLWKIEFHSLDKANIEFYQHVKLQEGQKINPNMPSGVTGQNQILLYLHDDKNIMKTLENSNRIQHELCHAVLYFLQKNKIAVSAVHENPSIFFIIYWYRKLFVWRKIQIAIIDIRSLAGKM